MTVLWARKPQPVFEPRRAEHGAEIWAVSWVLLLAELLRLAEPRGPNPTELGRGWCPGLGLYSRTRANSAIPRGIAGLVAQARSASGELGDRPNLKDLGGEWGRCFCGSEPAWPKTSPAKLQAYAWGDSGPRGSANRRFSAPFIPRGNATENRRHDREHGPNRSTSCGNPCKNHNPPPSKQTTPIRPYP